ncbi:Uncharacterized protein apha_02393 [Umezakia ovalisporum]|jgi:hypothetical protein|nr:hypothetical protein [Umezakia ovalisporum]MBI1240598.1 hypothetical protein [Nostoc sp. RI_552]MDH6095449.1 hypothetical protein [Umezakia ovalisporum CobakiLakeB]MDH6101690.1 hypothetical protein [Umezakia ovalisporum ANA283AFssAo]CEJ46239.1 Uncharacterized protein apha_02393 [Umezakia ovalisporum]
MKQNQSLNGKPNQLRDRTKTQSGLIGSSNIFIYLLIRHPGLLLTAFLTMMMATASLALYSLGYVDSVDKPEVEEISAIVEKPIITTSENSNPTPLWLVVAIALSCASGCLIIVRLINCPHQPQQVRRKLINSHRTSRSFTPNRHSNLKPTSLESEPVFVPLQPLKPVVTVAKSESEVRALPTENRHRLHKSKESLAELMDIRKNNSLSTILQKY